MLFNGCRDMILPPKSHNTTCGNKGYGEVTVVVAWQDFDNKAGSAYEKL